MAETATPQASLPARAVGFYHAVVAEMRRVTWPDREQVKDSTIKLIIFVLIVGAVITLMDFALQGILVRGIPSLFTGR